MYRFAGYDDAATGIRAHRIGKVTRLLDVPDHEVCFSSGRETPYRICEPERPGRIDGESAQRFFGRHAKDRAGEVHREQRRDERRRPGIAIGRNGDRNSKFAQARQRRERRLTQKIGGAGQEQRNGTRTCSR